MEENNQEGSALLQMKLETGPLEILTIVFIILKLTGLIVWSWWWVLSPLLIYGAIILLVVLAAAIIVMLETRRGYRFSWE